MMFLTSEEIVHIHDELVSQYGGLHRNRDLETVAKVHLHYHAPLCKDKKT